MKRRKFLKKLPLFASTPFLLNSIPINVLAGREHITRLAATSANDNVLVLIQLHGGNDGLNAVIPIDQYAEYYNLRPNLAISDNGPRKFIDLDSSLSATQRVGLHPDMNAMKDLYDRARVSIVHSISYENANGSHFRGRDVFFMGADYNEYLSSGWMGRFLDYEFPGYPDAYPTTEMPDPLALEFGSSMSLAFHRDNGIPVGLSIPGPDFFLLENLQNFDPPSGISDTHYGDELRYILDIEDATKTYGDKLKEEYAQGLKSKSSVIYPELYPFNAPRGSQRNGLAPQLEVVANLLSGGCKTKVFLVRLGGFDTHASQVEASDASMGGHAALLYHLSTAVQAFQNDLKARGIEDKVLTMTFSEFGRRPHSNASYGSDHGNAAPMFIFGKGVNPGTVGDVPSLTNLDNGNIAMQFDYRQVFAAIVKDWFEADDGAIAASRFGDWVDNRLPIIGKGVTSSKEAFLKDRFHLKDCYPNPIKEKATFGFMINSQGNVVLRILDIQGKEIKVIQDGELKAGEHSISTDLSDLQSGTYIYEIKTGLFKESKKLVKL